MQEQGPGSSSGRSWEIKLRAKSRSKPGQEIRRSNKRVEPRRKLEGTVKWSQVRLSSVAQTPPVLVCGVILG